MKIRLLFSSIVAVVLSAAAFAQTSMSPNLNTSALESKDALYQENKGQIVDTKGEQRPEILFTSFSKGVRTYYKADGISYVFEKHNGLSKPESMTMVDGKMPERKEVDPKDHTVEMHRIDLQLVGANPSPAIIKLDPSKTFDNFYLAHCRVSDVRSYGKVIYKNVYENIDMVLYNKEGQMKYDFIVYPGGDPSVIKFKIDGTDKKSVSEKGELILGSHLGEIIEGKPYSIQGGNEVASCYKLSGDELSFNISSYDKTKTLIIDPTRQWGTYYTADGYSEEWYGVSTDADATGSLFAINTTGSTYPVSVGVFDPSYNGNFDIRIAKFDPSGAFIWGTYLGGGSTDAWPAVSVGISGNFVMSGSTISNDFPTTLGTHDQSINGGWDFFICQFNSNSGTLNWSTFYGGSSDDMTPGVDVNSSGEIAFLGKTYSSNIPMVSAIDNSNNGGLDEVVAKFDNSGNLIWSTYFGGNSDEYSSRNQIKFDYNGNVIFGGTTISNNLPTTLGVFDQTFNGGWDLFLASINPTGTILNFCTYMGSGCDDAYIWGSGDGSGPIAICSDNSIITGGNGNGCNSSWAATVGTFSNTSPSGIDGYIIKFNSSGNRIWGTTIPGDCWNMMNDVEVDGSDNVFFLTGTCSNINTTAGGPFQAVNQGSWDKYIGKLSPNGSTLLYGTYLGSNDYETWTAGSLVYTGGGLYVPSLTYYGGFNPTWMTSAGAYQSSATGGVFYPVLNKFLFCDITTNGIVTNESCVGNDGAINLTATTTTEGVLSYVWSNGPTSEDVTGLNSGSYTVTVTGTTTGCSVSQSFTITNADNVPPVATCQAFTAQLDGAGNVMLNGSDIDGGSTDNCSIASLTASPNTLTCANIGINNVTLTVTDGTGNTATCVAVVTVEDNVAPVLTCPGSPITVSNDPGSCDAIVNYTTPTSTDNCATTAGFQVFNYTGGEQTFTAPFSGVFELEVWGAEGGTSYSTSQAGYINAGKGGYAKSLVSLTAGQTIYINVGGQGQTHILNSTGVMVGGYNGGGSSSGTTIYGGGGGGGGATHISTSTGILSSLAGNQSAVLIVGGGGGGAWACDDYQWINYRDGSDGGAGGGLTGQGAGYGYTMGYTQGNSNNNIMNQNDTRCQAYWNATGGSQIGGGTLLNPNGPCPFGLQSSLSGFGQGASSGNAASHSGGGGGGGWYGGGAGASGENANGTGGGGGSSYNNNDPLGDNIVGTAVMPNPLGGTMTGNSGNGIAKISWSLIGTVTTTQTAGLPSGSVFPVGTTTNTFEAIDAEGNISTCTFDVVVNDTELPIANCQNQTIQLDASGNASVAAAAINNLSSDNCGIASLSLSQTNFDCSDLGINTVTLTVLDVNGNSNTCLATVTVQDLIVPTVTCSDITVNNVPNNCGRVVTYTVPVATDNCSVTAIQTDGTGFTSGDLFPVGTTIQQYTYTDAGGNTTVCSFNVIVLDVQNPTITPLTFSNITVNNTLGMCGANVPWLEPTASDNCPGVILTASNTMGSFFPIGTTTVTYTATDASMNTSTLSFNVTVIDNEFPTITCPADIAANTDAGQCYATVSLGTPVATDNCLITSLTSNAPVTFPVGTTTVVWTAVDNQGNTVTCNQLVTVTDIEMPIAACQNISINLDGTGNATIVAADIDNASSDACGVTLSASQTAFTCANVGPNTVTLTVTDANGNVSTCTSTVTIVDNIAPVAACQNSTVQLDVTGNASITGASVDNGSTDNCAIASMTVLPNAFTCANIGANPVVLSVTDVNGNVSTCNATVTIEDNVTPVALCQNVDVFLDASGNGSTTAALVNNGSSDACGIASLTLSQTAFDCSEVGLNPVTLTVLDNNGNSSTCLADVNVIDNIAPVAVCQDITVQLDASGVGTIVVADINNGSSDACGIATMTLSQSSFSCAEVGTKLVTLTVTDVNGNSSTCTSTLTIEDNIAPIAVCQDITVQLDALGNAVITGTQINNGSSDACGIATLSVSPNTFDCTNIGGNAVVLTVTDVNGNASTCNATVTVQDNVAPTAVCQNITLFLDGTGNVSMVAADIDGGSTDACGIASLAASQTAFTCANIGANNVVLTVTDLYGNTSNCTAVVTVLETTPPVAVCQNISINLNAAGLATILPIDLNNGSTDNCSIANYSASQTSFDCTDLGVNTVTLTVTDGSGNATTCTSIVTVLDIILPTAICQDITVNLNAAGTVSITPNMINNGSFDNCTIATVSASQTAFTCANVGPNNVTLTITDQSGNTSTCTAIVTVADNIAPTAICQNATANLDASGNATIVVSDINDGSFDNCGILTTLLSTSAFTCANVGPNPVTLTVTDVNGNVSTCSSTVTVIDAIDPTMICQNISVNLDATGNTSIVANDLNNGSFDNCGIASLSASQVNFNCSNVGANNIILTATDVNGNTNTCTSVVTIIDAVAPNALCQNISVNLDASGNATITGAMINNGSTDACGIASLVASPAAFTCANVGPNSVTLTVLDVNGNTSTCTSIVTVVDNTAPTALCQNFTVNLDASGNATIASTDIDNGSFDNCGIVTVVVSPNTFTCSNVGANPVVLTVTDVNGLVSSCTASVTVVDNTAPTAICQDITVNLNAAGNATITGAMINNGSFDNCTIATVSVSPSSFNCANVGANPVVLTVTDVNGNSSTCTATVTVVDNMLPTAICQNQTINLDATGNAFITAATINNGSFDNCGIASLVASQTAFTCANVGANTVTLTVTDVNSNVSTCTSTITVIDNLAPTAICQNISVNLDVVGSATITAAMIDNGSNDNCGIASLTASQTSFNCSNVGSNNVTLTVLDVNGNSSTCNSIVTIVDNIAPTANCQNISINLNAAGNASITAGMLNNLSFDNCGIASFTTSQTNFDCSNVGANNVTLTVMDVNLNTSTCTSVVTVIDNIAPVAVCQNISVNLDATGNASITGAMVNNVSTDACGIASLVVSPAAFTCANVGSNPVTLTVTDVNGNASTCSSVVTVIDNMAPTAICQNITVNLDATGNASITAAMIDNGSTDNCSVASIAASTTSFTCANVGPNTVTLTVTDVNGNVSACNAIVTVVDVTAPTALCQNQTLTLDIFGNASTTSASLNNGSTDECGIASVLASQTIYDCSDLGANNITLTVTDVNGNISTCTSVVTVQDLIAPTVVTQNITVALDATGSVTITGAMITAAAFDNCAISSIVLPTSTFDCTDIGPNTVTLIVSDASGNTATGTAVVTVIDNMAPTALCQNVTINLDATGNASITEAMINNGSTDNCGIATVAASQLNFSCAHIGNNNVTLTVSDVNGNVATCLAVVTVLDPIAPVAVCQNVTLNLDANGDALLTPSMIENGSSDNCTIAFTSVSQANFTCVNTGANNITYTVTDNSGNSATCVSVVTIIDNIAPNAICENITVVLDATGNATITAAMIDNGSNDNCSVTLGASQTAFTCANVGANNVVLTVTDPSANVSTCTAIVTVVDNTAPIANCQNITVNLDAAGMATITGAMIDNGSTDACGLASVTASQTAFTCANVGPNNVTLTVTDVNGNTSTCTSIVTVVDNINPTAICQNVTISLNPSGAASITSAMINNGSFDNCGVASISAAQTAFDCTNLGANNITLTVTDVNGNVGTCVAIVTVIDGIAPVITCPSSVTVNADAGICGATVALTSPIATDNCTVTITNNAPVLFPLGTTTVTWTATDAAGNTATCSNTVTVIDNQAPTITCPANITVNTDANICFATGVNLGTPVTTDNCTVASVTNNAPAVFPLGTTTILWTVVDQAGNTSTCTQTVTVVDNQAPVVVCTSDIVLETVAGSCGRVVNYSTPLVVDNCSVISMTQSDATGYTSGDIFPVGTTVISYTAVDGSGNTYTCSFNVTIEDNQHPVLTSCPADITVSSAEGSCDVAVSWVSPTANDNCPGVQLTTTHPSGSLFGPGTTVVTYQAMDNSGNITACSFNVTVLDGNAPIVPVLADVYNSCQVNSLPSPVADDICAGEITGTTTTIFPITTVGIIPVVWTFNDGNGNISTATQYVYIDGDIDATVTIVNDLTLMANNTNATYQWIDCATGNAIPGATNQTFVATVNGDYAVVLTENGCPAETSDCISIRNVGIEDVTISELSIYPNPAMGGVFTISFDGKIEKIEVVDMIGRLIAVDTNLENGTVNGSELASGKYFVKVYSQGQIIAKEVIIIND